MKSCKNIYKMQVRKWLTFFLLQCPGFIVWVKRSGIQSALCSGVNKSITEHVQSKYTISLQQGIGSLVYNLLDQCLWYLPSNKNKKLKRVSLARNSFDPCNTQTQAQRRVLARNIVAMRYFSTITFSQCLHSSTASPWPVGNTSIPMHAKALLSQIKCYAGRMMHVIFMAATLSALPRALFAAPITF